jgi:hypothetical protein
LWDQVVHYGLFKTNRAERGSDILPIDEVRTMAAARAKTLKDRHLSSGFVIEILDPTSIFLIVDAGEWDQSCREKMQSLIQDDAGMDAFVLVMFGGIYTTGREFIAELMDFEPYQERLKARMASDSLKSAHWTIRKALEKALGRS